MANTWDNINTDDYDIYGQQGSPTPLPGAPSIDESGHLVTPPYSDPVYFPAPSNPSVMDPDPNNTGPTTDFWTSFPITIDIDGYIYYYGQNTGINVRGPAGASSVRFEDLTPAQKEELRGTAGANGINGVNGVDGQDGANGLSAYELWLKENGWLDHPELHPISEFFEYLADIEDMLIKEGTGTGSLIVNNKGEDNTANGVSSFASGYETAANGNYSSTFGKGTIANRIYSAAFGAYNIGNSSNLFEIGNGTSSVRSNAFSVASNGNVTAGGEITDNGGNVLSNKVDKITGKGLSTNDFTDNYKDFLDQYTVDEALNAGSINPVTNAAITTAINNIVSLNGKPSQSETNANTDLVFGYISDTSAVALNEIKWNSGLKWNPSKNILKNNNITTSTFSNIFSFGTQGLTATANDQVILGKYNVPNANDYLEIGYGTVSTPKNIFTISKTGNIVAAGDVTDGNGNVLSNKQNILSWDTLPTQNSTKPVTSGGLYNLFTSFGVNVSTGTLTIPAITQLQNQVSSLTSRVAALEAAVAAIGNPRLIPDDIYPAHIYTYGIRNDEFYITMVDDGEPDEEEEEEEENE